MANSLKYILAISGVLMFYILTAIILGVYVLT